jgi:spermidine/putrescine transport system substrate-binding protein
MLRKLILVFWGGLLVVGAPIFAQDATPEDAIKTTWKCPADFRGQTLNLYFWTTYIAEDTIPNFEKLCGVTVNVDYIGSSEEIIARLRQGNPGYDITTQTDNFIRLMVKEGLLEPLDLTKIPNFANVEKRLVNPVYDSGNKYTVPYQWGTNGIGYNVKKVGKEVTSWYDLFNFDGNVSWVDDPRGMFSVALKLLDLDPNSQNPDDIAKARDFLVDHGKNVKTIAEDDGQEKLAAGEVDMVVEYSGDIFQVMSDCDSNPDKNCQGEFAYAIPQEGTIIWVDNMVIPKDAPHKELAEAWMDYILDPQVGADVSNYTAYATPNQKSLDDELISEDLLANAMIYPSPEVAQRLFYVTDVGDAAQAYNDAWSEVKVRLGL